MKKIRIFVMMVLLGVLFPIHTALACSCTIDAWTQESSAENIQNSTMIFEGEAVRISSPSLEGRIRQILEDVLGKNLTDVPPNKSPYYSKLKLKVSNFYKGQRQDTVTAFFMAKSSCLAYEINKGKKILFMLYDSDGLLIVPSACGHYISDSDREALLRGDYKGK